MLYPGSAFTLIEARDPRSDHDFTHYIIIKGGWIASTLAHKPLSPLSIYYYTPMANTPESKVDVLIIGAGPAGLMCAQGLARAGVDVRIIDERAAKVAAGQADGIQPRTIEVLQSYGLAERLLREANQMHMCAFYNPGPNGGIERTARAPDITAPTARYPFECTLHQGAIEAIFLDTLASLGQKVHRPIAPTSIELSSDDRELLNPETYPITARLKHLDSSSDENTEVVRAKFLVGCDGAHSWVRKNFGIQMEGEQTNYIWGVMDFVPDTNFPDIRNRTAIHSRNGSCMIIPREGDIVRLYIQLSDSDVVDPITKRVDKNRMSPEKLLKVARKSFEPYYINDPQEIEWWTVYIIGQRVASQFSVHERVFIAGDACHTHSPKAGQGMNASMNDTHNLIWKLTHVLRGWADMPLLKTYEFERRKYAQDLINFDKKFSALFSGKAHTNDLKDGVTHEEFMRVFQTFGSFTSGIGIHYAPSYIVNTAYQSYARNLIIGQRLVPHIFIRAADARPIEIQDYAPADNRFKVIVFAGDVVKPEQRERLQTLEEELNRPTSFLRKHERKGDVYEAFDMITVCAGTKDTVSYTDVPPLLRPHWSKVLLDDVDVTGKKGGGGYDYYGIKAEGTIVVVRPDGYVGFVVPFDKIDDLNDYFGSFARIIA